MSTSSRPTVILVCTVACVVVLAVMAVAFLPSGSPPLASEPARIENGERSGKGAPSVAPNRVPRTLSSAGIDIAPPGSPAASGRSEGAGPAAQFPLGRRLSECRSAWDVATLLYDLRVEGGEARIAEALSQWNSLLGEGRHSERPGLLAGLSFSAWRVGDRERAKQAIVEAQCALAEWDPASRFEVDELVLGPNSFPWSKEERADPTRSGFGTSTGFEYYWGTRVGPSLMPSEWQDDFTPYRDWLLEVSLTDTDPLVSACTSLWGHALWASENGCPVTSLLPAGVRLLREKYPERWSSTSPPPTWKDFEMAIKELSARGDRAALDLARMRDSRQTQRNVNRAGATVVNSYLAEWSLREEVVLRHSHDPDPRVREIVDLARRCLHGAWGGSAQALVREGVK